MRITSESDYALRIITAMSKKDGVTDAKTLAEETNVTLRFTLKILNKLVGGGIAESYKGSKGGYKLKLSADKISLKMIIELIDGPIAIVRCLESAECCSLNQDKTACEYHHIFDYISLDLASKLGKITILDVINKNYEL
jgi:Rrf2 family protein